MMLGECECDYETAYFLKNGKYPPRGNKCKLGIPEVSRNDEIWDNEPDQYILYRGWRISEFFYY